MSTFDLVPAGNSITDPDGSSKSTFITIGLVETTVLTPNQTNLAKISLDTTQTKITVDTMGSSEMGVHLISVKMTDSDGAFC